MRRDKLPALVIYRVLDWTMAAFAWLFFFIYRKRMEEPGIVMDQILDDNKLWLGLAIIPLVWIIYYSIMYLSYIHIISPKKAPPHTRFQFITYTSVGQGNRVT